MAINYAKMFNRHTTPKSQADSGFEPGSQLAGSTLVLGMPAGFVPLKKGKAGSTAANTEESGES